MGSRKPGDSGNIVAAFEGDLNAIVKEYLAYCGFQKTELIFEKEVKEKSRPIRDSPARTWNKKKKDLQTDIMNLFNMGARKEFFRIWDENIPEGIRRGDATCKKLEFYLNIYFAIFPINYQMSTGKKSSIKVEDAMNDFKSFIETRGAVLSQTTEFLPFYALPFVPDPIKHPAYKELFLDQWVPDLRLRVEKFLALTLPARPQPRLFEIYQDVPNEMSTQLQQLQQNVIDAEKKATGYVKRYNYLQSDYHNLIGITAELVDSLENCINGKMVTPEYLQTVCARLFTTQLRESMDTTRPGTAAQYVRSSVAHFSLENVEELPSLDYAKIKSAMVCAEPREQAKLLQALRWRLTQSEEGEQRTRVVKDLVNNDILGCRMDSKLLEQLLNILTSDDLIAQQYMSRFINALASLSPGRSYLAIEPCIVTQLKKVVQDEKLDLITRENALGAMQKLSLRRGPQNAMIENGLVDWLVSVLEEHENQSDYILEFSAALTMNLCLRTAGKRQCIKMRGKILKVLLDIFDHQEIQPFLNGTLYSLLDLPEIREEAKEMGLEDMLKCFMEEEPDSDLNRQLHYIIKKLNIDAVAEESESDDEDEDENEEDADQDSMEADLDKKELLRPRSGELTGDKLLYTHYMMGSGDGPNQSNYSYPQQFNMNGQNSRPPTRSGSRGGSRPSSQTSAGQLTQPPPPLNLKKDPEAQQILANELGTDRPVVTAVDKTPMKPTAPQNGRHNSEYNAAFGTRPKIPRTPEGGRPVSRGMTPVPMPKLSDSLPQTRPPSGGNKTNKRK
ncbi:lisH domain-containing protein ARMC9-like isoform X2 [Antedon mediterranea]|uniref:lisH domain-containing protein ARMC9-like isoform X2 n=1 Tax=Antedon mediterranea TaxID=105859 RepID=UPI003AF6F93E